MKRFTNTLATVATAATMLFAGLAATGMASADGTGQIEGGAPVYEVRNLTTGGAYSDNATVDSCQQLGYSIRLHNSGFTAVNNIHVQVALPAAASTSNTSTATITYTDGLTPSTTDTTNVSSASARSIAYHAGSTQLFDGAGNLVTTEADGLVNAGGLNLGSLNGSTTEYLNFKADTDCTPPVTPTFMCNALTITADVNRTVKISGFNTSATNGAVFKNAVLDWGDNSALVTSANIVGLTHQYAKDGTYTIAAVAHFTVNGQDVTSGGSQCAQQVTFTSNKPPKVVPPTTPPSTPPSTPATPAAPTSLVNTGAGSTLGLFAAATVAGTLGYRRLLTRRLTRQ